MGEGYRKREDRRDERNDRYRYRTQIDQRNARRVQNEEKRKTNPDRYFPRRRSRSRSPQSSKSPSAPPEKPNFKPTGLLAAESRKTTEGTVLKYHEPADAAKPGTVYRLQEFRNGVFSDVYKLNKSSYLIGRDTTVCDIVLDEKECSSQHAVIQFRRITKRDKYGDSVSQIKPYIIDLDSTNGTCVDGHDVPSSRYVEIRPKDMIVFGGSTAVDFMFLEER